MGIEGIEISKLSGKLQQLATAADDGNGVIENNEIEIFKGYADAAVKNGQVSEDDYKAIFGADIKTKEEAKADTIFKKVLPEDLMKFGLIPEFAGRLPVVVTLDSLDKDALIKILQEPKNALIKQYQHFLAMDNVELEFEDGALVAIAEEALKRNAGARGLRSIIEEVMRNVMYEVPSRIDVVKCVVTEAAIREHMEPKMVVAS